MLSFALKTSEIYIYWRENKSTTLSFMLDNSFINCPDCSKAYLHLSSNGGDEGAGVEIFRAYSIPPPKIC